MSNGKSLFLLDVDSIQNYIFDTNRLKTIIGASWLVDHINAADDGDTLELLKRPEYGFTTKGDTAEIRKSPDFIYSSGGNTKIILDRDYVQDFEKAITRAYAKYGISVTTHIQSMDSDFIKKTLLPAEAALAQKKYNKDFNSGIPSSPYFKICELCGKRYAEAERDGVIMCDICSRKYEERKKRPRLFPNYDFIVDMEKMKKYLKSDMVAVVVMDGNRMGEKVARLPSHSDLKKFAKELENTIKESFDECLSDSFPSEKESKSFNSIRPLIMGGDDLCFIIDAVAALDFINEFIEKITEKSKTQKALFGQKGIQFSVGVLFVKPNYAFNFAYRIAHSLLRSAKRYSREHGDCSAVDFHFLLTSSGDEIEMTREREYQYEGHLLTQKPYPAKKLPDLKADAGQLQLLARNKVKSLRQILRLGRDQSTVELLKYAVRMNKQERGKYKKLLNDYGWKSIRESIWCTGLLDLAELTELVRR